MIQGTNQKNEWRRRTKFWTSSELESVLKVFRTSRLLRFFGFVGFISFLIALLLFAFYFGNSEGALTSFFIIISFGLVSGFLGFVCFTSKVSFFNDRIEVSIFPRFYKAAYFEIDCIVEDASFPGRYLVIKKNGQKIPISQYWFRNTKEILDFLQKKIIHENSLEGIR